MRGCAGRILSGIWLQFRRNGEGCQETPLSWVKDARQARRWPGILELCADPLPDVWSLDLPL